MQRYVVGDAETEIEKRDDQSVDLIVTSPPYWTLKDYRHPRQIGSQECYEEYLARLGGVWRQCWRVLRPGCKMVVNVGDQFLRGRENRGVYSVQPIHADVIHQMRDLAEAIYLGGVIWRKISTTRTSGGGCWMGSIYYPRDGYVTYEHEFVLIFKKRGKARRVSSEIKEQSRLTKDQRSRWFRGIWDDVRPERQVGHEAMFPVELPARVIQMFSFVGELVLDPFVGSGTVLEAAARTRRHGIGIDLNPDFFTLAQERLRTVGEELQREEHHGPERAGGSSSSCPGTSIRSTTRRGPCSGLSGRESPSSV